ncbi:MAG: hypothetical protein IJ068_06260 [Bacilli bacterium]|nr:hypothetical protein [Bacilli bacterium]
MKYNLNVLKFEINNIYIKDIIDDKSYFIGYSIFSSILNDQDNYLKFKSGLLDNNISTITILNNQDKILEVNKIVFLEGIFQYLERNNLDNQELHDIYQNLNYSNYVNKNSIYNLDIDNKNYSFDILDYFSFLELSDDLYNKAINELEYKGVDLEYFTYSLISYFKENKLFSKYVFSDSIKNRFIDLMQYKKIDCEALNKILITKDNLSNKFDLSNDIKDILNTKYDNDKLKNIIMCYIKLCKTFNYDEIYYLDESNVDTLKHHDYNYLSQINKTNNKIVCFEFTSIFGYYLNSLGINYEVIGMSDYGIHSYLVFRLDNYLIKVEAIKSVFDNDLTNVRIKFPLTGIECLNKNDLTREKFNDILDDCYKSSLVSFENDYLPTNKINNSNDLGNLNDYILKIDLIFKKIKDLDLSVIDKLSYFKKLIKLVFTSRELELNVFYTTLTSFSDVVFVIALNQVSYQNLDNIYLIYENNNLSIIKKEELESKIQNNEFSYLTSKEIPGINRKRK